MPKSIWDTRFSSRKAVTFDEALKMSGMSLDEWITMKGSHVLLGEAGEILGGLGGKFKNLSDVPRNTVKQREGESDRAFQKRAKKELGITPGSNKKTADKKQKAEAGTKQKDKGEAKPKKEIKATPEQKEQFENHVRYETRKGHYQEDGRDLRNVQNLTDNDMKPSFPGDYSKVGRLTDLQAKAKEDLNFAKAPWGHADNPLFEAEAQEIYDNVTEKLARAKEIYNEEKKNWPDKERVEGMEQAIRNLHYFAREDIGKFPEARVAPTKDVTNYEPDYFGQELATSTLDIYISDIDKEIKYIEKNGTDDGTYQTKYYLEALKMKNDELKDYREKVLAHNKEFEKEQWPEKYAAREKEEKRAERAARKDERQRKKEGYNEREWNRLKEFRANDKNDKDKRRYHLYTSDYLSGNGKGHIVKPEEVFKIGREHGFDELYIRSERNDLQDEYGRRIDWGETAQMIMNRDWE